jgi:hypothetical protein
MEVQMTAMMIVMIFFLAMGPHHGFSGSRDSTPPSAEAPHMQADHMSGPAAARQDPDWR